MKSVGIRFARTVNRVFGQKGPVLLERFHSHVLRTPKEVRHALAYVLLNVRKHFEERRGTAPPVRLDEASSGRWFDGWKRPPPWTGSSGVRDVAPARFWLTRELWRSYGLIDPTEVPGPAWRAKRARRQRRQRRMARRARPAAPRSQRDPTSHRRPIGMPPRWHAAIAVTARAHRALQTLLRTRAPSAEHRQLAPGGGSR